MTAALLLNILFSTVVCTMLVGLLAWAIATQRADDGLSPTPKTGPAVPLARRRIRLTASGSGRQANRTDACRRALDAAWAKPADRRNPPPGALRIERPANRPHIDSEVWRIPTQ